MGGGSRDYTGRFQRLYGGVCKVIFISNSTLVEVDLCCVVVGVVTICSTHKVVLNLFAVDFSLKFTVKFSVNI